MAIRRFVGGISTSLGHWERGEAGIILIAEVMGEGCQLVARAPIRGCCLSRDFA